MSTTGHVITSSDIVFHFWRSVPDPHVPRDLMLQKLVSENSVRNLEFGVKIKLWCWSTMMNVMYTSAFSGRGIHKYYTSPPHDVSQQIYIFVILQVVGKSGRLGRGWL